jgi:hypothetical protein
VSKIATNPQIEEFYLGRANDLTTAKSRHKCDEIIPLYETSSADNAIEVENDLIKSFRTHRKCNNDATHGGGGASDEYINYVYIATWRK